jgi:MATE family multidrug resistance protein
MSNPYGNRAIWRIAAPMMLSGISVPLLGLVDTAVLGHLSSADYLGAAAIGSTIFSILFMSLNFLRMGTTGLTAQALGAGNPVTQVAGLQQPLMIALGIAALIMLLQTPIFSMALLLLGPGDSVAELAGTYFSIRVLSAPFALANFVMIGWLLGMQNARGPLLITLILNGSNILLDLVFVVGLGMTVDGVALATLIAEILAFVSGCSFVVSTLRDAGLATNIFRWAGGETLSRLLDVNGSLFIRTITLMFTFAFITAQGARLGDVTLAANALLMNFLLLLSYALDGIAHAAEALTGKALGKQNPAGLQEAVKGTMSWSLLVAALFTLTYFAGGELLIGVLSTLPEIRDSAMRYLPWLIALPFAAVLAFLYDGVFVGLTRTREMSIVMVLSASLIFLPGWYVARGWGNHALWFALIAFMCVRSLGMHGWYVWLIRHNALFESTDRDDSKT